MEQGVGRSLESLAEVTGGKEGVGVEVNRSSDSCKSLVMSDSLSLAVLR